MKRPGEGRREEEETKTAGQEKIDTEKKGQGKTRKEGKAGAKAAELVRGRGSRRIGQHQVIRAVCHVQVIGFLRVYH